MDSQKYLIEQKADKRIIVNAGPGTGKTWSLIEKLIYMVNDLKIKPDEILVLCFSRAAVNVIQTRLKNAFNGKDAVNNLWREIKVRTFDSFSTSLIIYTITNMKENNPRLLPYNYDLDENDYDSRIRTAKEILEKKKNMLGLYKHIMIDEVQDLVGCRADLVLQLLKNLNKECGFTIFGDSCQAIYDYLANNRNITTSNKFYIDLLNLFPNAEKLEFTVNHRQLNKKLEEISIPYRKAILEQKNRNELEAIYTKIKEKIPLITKDKLSCITEYYINRIKQDGTLGILTRKNGIALMISTYLQHIKVPHILQRNSNYYNRWIADFFTAYEPNTITKKIFYDKAKDILENAGLDKKECWLAITEKVHAGKNGYYSVEDILRSLYRHMPKNNVLFIQSGRSSDVIISTIHRAKGLEFDRVLLIDTEDDDWDRDNREQDVLSEHKVRYVALTRARKNIAKCIMNEDYKYIYTDINDTRRCSKADRRKLTHIEIGCAGDVDECSFLLNPDTQSYIKSELKQYDRLELRKTSSKYHICHNNRILGQTGDSFFNGITRAQRRMKNYNDNWYIENIDSPLVEEDYPNSFNEVYVEDIITCIGRNHEKGNISVWHGFSIRGFAKKVQFR